MSAELLPCPWCARPALISGDFGMQGLGCSDMTGECPGSLCALPAHTPERRASAIAAWNTRAAQPSQWQPIETAPKDHTDVLAWRSDWGSFVARWTYAAALLSDREQEGIDDDTLFSEHWFTSEGGARLDGSEAPTHWMPLPSAPDCGGKGAA